MSSLVLTLSTTSLGSPLWFLTTLARTNFFFLCLDGISCILFCASCLSQEELHSQEEPGFLISISCTSQVFINTSSLIRPEPPEFHTFSKLQSPYSQSLSRAKILQCLSLSWLLTGFMPVCQSFSCTWKPRTGPSTLDVVSPGLNLLPMLLLTQNKLFWPSYCNCVLLTHDQLGDHQDPKVLLCRAAFKPILVHGIAAPQVKDFLFLLMERLEILLCPFPSMSRSLWVMAQAPGTSAIPLYHLPTYEGVHCPTIGVINEDVNWCWPQHRSLRHYTLVTCLQLNFCHSSQLPGPSYSQSPSLSISPTLPSLAGLLQVVWKALLKPN